MSYQRKLAELLADPSAHDKLKQAARAFDASDCLDAKYNARALAALMELRCIECGFTGQANIQERI